MCPDTNSPESNACTNLFEVIQNHKKNAGSRFADWVYLDIHGNIVKGEQLMSAKDGCEIHQLLGVSHIICRCPEHNQRFLLKDSKSGEPLPRAYYQIKNATGIIVAGETDSDGLSQKVHAKEEEWIEIVIFSKKRTRKNLLNTIPAANGQIPIKKLKTKTTVKTDINPFIVEVDMPKDMTFSMNGIEMLKAKEGKRMEKGKHILYDDQALNATIGYGYLVHMGKVGSDKVSEKPFINGIDENKALKLLKETIIEFENTVNQAIEDTMEQNEFDAFVLLAYNIGSNAFRKSSIVSKFNEGDKMGAGTRFLDWCKIKVNGKLEESKGLKNRRIEEKNLFESGLYSK